MSFSATLENEAFVLYLTQLDISGPKLVYVCFYLLFYCEIILTKLMTNSNVKV